MTFVLPAVLVLCCWGGIFSSALAVTSPGIEVRLLQKGLDYLTANVLYPLEKKEISSLQIPNTSLSVEGFTVNLTNVQLGNVTTYQPELVPSASLSALVVTAKADVPGLANFTFRQNSWPHTSGHGYFDFFAKGVTIKLGVGVEPASDGSWNFTLRENDVIISSLSLTFHESKASFLLNLLKSVIEDKAKSAIKSQAQQQVTAAITLLKMILKNYLPVLPLKDGFALNLSLIRSADRWKDNCYMQLGVLGLVLYNGHGVLPFPPPVYPDTANCSGKMVTAHVSTSTISSGLAALSESGLVNQVQNLKLLTNNTLLHTFFPDITKVTPVGTVWMNVTLGESTLHSTPGHLQMSTTIVAQVDLHLENGTIWYNAAKLSVGLEGVFEVWLQTISTPDGPLQAVCVNISYLEAVSVKELDSSIGHIDEAFMEETINILVTERLPELNHLMNEGIYILPEDFKLVEIGNVTLTIGQEDIKLGADFKSRKSETTPLLDLYLPEVVSPLFENIADASSFLMSSVSNGMNTLLQYFFFYPVKLNF